MSELTLTINDDDLAQLTRISGTLGKSLRRTAESILHRTLAQTAGRQPRSNQQRAATRARRQLEITRLLSRRKHPTLSMVEREKLAQQFGTSVRTITRDLEVAILAISPRDSTPTPARTAIAS